MRNEGEEGYKTEFFGDKITFKRTISDKGASAVSIVGESSRAMSAEAFVVGLGFLPNANLGLLSDSITVLPASIPAVTAE